MAGVTPYRMNIHGPFQMSLEGADPVVFPARTASAVLAFLAMHKGRPVARKELARTLWPDQHTEAAKTNLRSALYRVRKSLPGNDPLIPDGETIRLDTNVVETDLDRADRLRRTFLLAPDQPDGLEALKSEWELRKQPLLDGWDFEWVDPYRDRAWFTANDIGCELAKALEGRDEPARSLAVWLEVLDRVPHHAEALKHALRLEYQLNGKERAAELAKQATLSFRADLGIEMPRELQRTLKDIRAGLLEPVAQPEFVRKRSELFLLARMFESNLRANRTEALAMLARECTVPAAVTHPRAMLGLATLALNQTEGVSTERLQVANQAAFLASWVGEFEQGHQWSDFILSSLEPSEPMYGSVLSMKGFMHFEQREYAKARECLERTIEVMSAAGRQDEVLRAMSRLAGVKWHQLEIDEAIETYLSIAEAVSGRTDENARSILAMAHGNLCFVYAADQQWANTLKHWELGRGYLEANPMYSFVVYAPVGLANFASGNLVQGLRELAKSVSVTSREGMPRFNQISVDFAGIAIAMSGREEAAACIFQANTQHRSVLHHERSPAEACLVQAMTDVDPERLSSKNLANPLLGQSAGTLSEWVCDELERLQAAQV